MSSMDLELRVRIQGLMVVRWLCFLLVCCCCTTGDVELSMAEAMATAAILLDDSTLFDRALRILRHRLPSFIFVSSIDGGSPHPPPHSIDASAPTLAHSWCVGSVRYIVVKNCFFASCPMRNRVFVSF